MAAAPVFLPDGRSTAFADCLQRFRGAWIVGLWFVFGEMAYQLLRGAPLPRWHDAPRYGSGYLGYLLGFGVVQLLRKRRDRPRQPPQPPDSR